MTCYWEYLFRFRRPVSCEVTYQSQDLTGGHSVSQTHLVEHIVAFHCMHSLLFKIVLLFVLRHLKQMQITSAERYMLFDHFLAFERPEPHPSYLALNQKLLPTFKFRTDTHTDTIFWGHKN